MEAGVISGSMLRFFHPTGGSHTGGGTVWYLQTAGGDQADTDLWS